MCGISGCVNTDLIPIASSLNHRGPDNFGVSLGTVSLGHNRLAILDLSVNGNQPLENERYAFVYNGEVYNYKDFYNGTSNDACGVFDLICRVGVENALKYLNGMFAFAVYDKLEQKLHLCVDRFSQKPLYYYHSGKVFAFASSPNALLHLRNNWKLNKKALDSYWALGSVVGKSSIWDGIYKLNGSMHLVFDIEKNTCTESKYWTPEFQSNVSGITDLIKDAIDKTFMADVPVFIFLSGGIDSTIVASRAQKGHAIHLDSDELVYAQEVAKKYSLDLKLCSPDSITIDHFFEYLQKCGEPSMSGIIPFITAKEASKYCKVAISANGADELFFGYSRTSDKITSTQRDHIFRKTGYVYDIDPIDERLSEGRWFELQTYVQFDLNKTLDFASMASSLEVRCPYLDHRLVEMALSIPEAGHGRKEILKNILRTEGFSESFVNRPKKGFSITFKTKKWLESEDIAFNWCVRNKWIVLKEKSLSKRDILYLKASALSFYYFYQNFKDKISGIN